MQYRRLGRTNLEVSEIGFGAWGIGKGWWGETDDPLSIQTLLRAFELGVTFIDTAYGYGDGHSEQLIAKAFQEYRERVTVATKIPLKTRDWPPKPGTRAKEAFPSAWIIEHTENSLRNLRTDCIDLQQLHIWRDEWVQESEWRAAIERLTQQGKIRFFGVSLIDHAPETGLEVVRSGLVDTVQVIYNIFDQSPAQELFPLCQQADVGVIARVPLDEGGLTGKLRPDTHLDPDTFQGHYFRDERLEETCTRADRLKAFLRDGVETLPKLALRFCLSHPVVSTVIPGMRRPAHVEENCTVPDAPTLTPEELEELKAHAWPRNFYQ
ncbi:MAG: aldo/keto reductase [candidate division NC10 bacterium]|nr:aldo/keto reductase [candidate division NC10 bacterium]